MNPSLSGPGFAVGEDPDLLGLTPRERRRMLQQRLGRLAPRGCRQSRFAFAEDVPGGDPPSPVRRARPARHVKVVAVGEAPAYYLRPLGRPVMVAELVREMIASHTWCDPEKECVLALHLNRKNLLKSYTVVSLGTATSCLTHPREVFRAAIVAAAHAVIVVHNHPSGDPSPSAADLQVTRQLRDAARAVDIDLLDHIVVGDPIVDPRGLGYYSFRESGVI